MSESLLVNSTPCRDIYITYSSSGLMLDMIDDCRRPITRRQHPHLNGSLATKNEGHNAPSISGVTGILA